MAHLELRHILARGTMICQSAFIIHQCSLLHIFSLLTHKAAKEIDKGFLPVTKWIGEYNKDKAIGDFTAGLTVALTVIPQSLAYANLAGLPVQYGLYSSFMGVFLYTLLGTSKDVTLGPTAIMSLIVGQYGAMEWFNDPENPTDPRCAVILSLMSGIVLLIMSVFKLGFLVNYVSHSVICGFTCAASIIIAFSQVKKLLGLKNIGRHFYEAIVDVPKNIHKTRVSDLVVGLICMVVLHSLKIIKQKYTDPKDFPADAAPARIMRKVLWFVCTARNAFVIVLVSVIAFGMDPAASGHKFTMTGEIQGGLPPFKISGPPSLSGWYNVTPETKKHLEFVPEVDKHHRRRRRDASSPATIDKLLLDVSANVTVPPVSTSLPVSNHTEDSADGHVDCHRGGPGCVEVNISTGKTLSSLMAGIFIVAIMGYVESVAIAKGFARKFNYKIDPGQELVAIGLCNLISSFVSSYPVTGSFSRTAVNAQSGVQTPAGGVVTGLIVVIATAFLTPLFKYIPTAALAAVIMLAAISMFDTDGVKHAWRVNKMDLLPLLITFGVCFYEIAIGIGCGILVSLAIVLYPHARPTIELDNVDNGRGCIVKMDRGFDFPGAEYLEDVLVQNATYGGYDWLICDMSKISHLDLGGVDALQTAASHCYKKEVAFRVVIPDEKLHAKLVAAGHTEEEQKKLREVISLTLGSAMVQVGKSKISEMVESDTPESDKDLKQRRPVGSTSSNGLFVTSPIIRGTHRGDFDEPPNYTEYDDKTL